MLVSFFAVGVSAAEHVRSDTTRTISDVVVTGTRTVTDIRHLPQTVSVVGRDLLTKDERPSLLPTLMEQVPSLMVTGRGMMGYDVSKGGSGGMVLRGISSSQGQMMVLIDGHPQYSGIYGHSIADSYETMMAERVEVLRGPASMLYGSNAMGGVVNIVTRQPKKDGVNTEFNLGAGSYGTVQAQGSNQIKYRRFTSNVAAEYERTDNHRPDMGFEQYGGFVKLGYKFSDHWNLWADGDVTHFTSHFPGATDAPMYEADRWITRGNVAVGIENGYEKTNGRVSAYGNFGRHTINDGYKVSGGTPQANLFQSSDALAGISAYQSAMLWPGGRLTAGVDYQHIYGHAWYTSRKTGEIVDPGSKQSALADIDEIAVYLSMRQDIKRWLTVDMGLRYDHHSVTGGEWVPEAGVVYRPMKTGSLKFMASKGFRNPTVKDMYLYAASTENLLPERMWSFDLSWRQNLLKGKLMYSVGAFYIMADNIIQTVNRKNVNTGELRNRGFEAEATWRINKHWMVNTNHSYLYMEKTVVNAPKYKGYVGGTMTLKRWMASIGAMFVAGMYTTDVDSKSAVVDPASANVKSEGFVMLNATVKYQVLKFMQLWLRGENLLDRSYEYTKNMPMPGINFMAGVNIKI